MITPDPKPNDSCGRRRAMKLLHWNIRQGGGKRQDDIAQAICGHCPEICILVEYRPDSGTQLARRLRDNGLVHQARSVPDGKENAILLSARTPVRVTDDHASCPAVARKWLEVELPDLGLFLGALHMPNTSEDKNGRRKREFWNAVLTMADLRRNEPYMLVGDFNTGKNGIDVEGTPLDCQDCMDAMEELGYVEAWRHLFPTQREYTWYSQTGNGYRIDLAYLSPALRSQLLSARYSHGERVAGYSDHSPLIVELAAN